MSAKGTPKKPVAPPTVLVITLEPDGNGSLLTRRGDLAHLSQFTYRGMTEIIAAIQSGAVALGTLEQNPPTIDIPVPQSEANPVDEAQTTDEPQPAEAEKVIDPEPQPETVPPEPQATLF